ncbi:uncharacterized protein BJX67DRAFT_377496 [Aspergillus lucknowensis]|uniref:Uncharacterized protein n=1 Tax=Aspergillus lucknowensis TaxID=176173 RepID=A0ABR4M2A9_9EURO
MKIRPPPSHALGTALSLVLSACVVVSAISFQLILHDIHHIILRRSLPGSLAFAPEGAVGQYEPPPGPIVYGPLPTTTVELPESITPPLTAEEADVDGAVHESKETAATDTPGKVDDPRKHIPPASEMNAFILKASTGSASKSVVQSLAGLVAPILASLLRL